MSRKVQNLAKKKQHDRMKQKAQKLTDELLAWVGKLCPYCRLMMGERRLQRRPTRDHILPKSGGWLLTARNRLIVCQCCNNDKGNRDVWAWAEYLAEVRDWRAPIVARFIEGLDYNALVEDNLRAKKEVAEEAERKRVLREQCDRELEEVGGCCPDREPLGDGARPEIGDQRDRTVECASGSLFRDASKSGVGS